MSWPRSCCPSCWCCSAWPSRWAGWPRPDHAHLLALLRNPLTRLGLLGICALALVHAAHRLRFTVEHALQLRRYDAIIATVCYGGALVGTVAAAYLLFGAL